MYYKLERRLNRIKNELDYNKDEIFTVGLVSIAVIIGVYEAYKTGGKVSYNRIFKLLKKNQGKDLLFFDGKRHFIVNNK